jgi:hypothetical protein
VQRALFVKQVQQQHRLPLAAIKGLVRALDQGLDVAPLVELQAVLFGRQGIRGLTPAGFSRKTGLSEDQVADLCRRRLLIPLEDGHFDAQDLALGRLLARGLALGIDPADLDFYPRLAAEIVDHEMALRNRHTREMGFEQNAGITLELTGIARSLRAYVIDRTLQRKLIRYQGLKPDKKSGPEPGSGATDTSTRHPNPNPNPNP